MTILRLRGSVSPSRALSHISCYVTISLLFVTLLSATIAYRSQTPYRQSSRSVNQKSFQSSVLSTSLTQRFAGAVEPSVAPWSPRRSWYVLRGVLLSAKKSRAAVSVLLAEKRLLGQRQEFQIDLPIA
jgi:hypothetical protein